MRTPTPFPRAPESILSHSSKIFVESRTAASLSRISESLARGSSEQDTEGSESNESHEQSQNIVRREPSQLGCRLTKRVYFLSERQDINEYRFPVAISQPNQVWRPGDGFSDDEASPGFIFFLTGHKRRRQRTSLPALGSLPIRPHEEQASAIRDPYKRLNQARRRSIRRVKPSRAAPRDIWPTYANFMESILPARHEQSPKLDAGDVATLVTQSNVVRVPHTHEPLPTVKYVPRRRKTPLAFRRLSNSTDPEVCNTSTMLRVAVPRTLSTPEDTKSALSEGSEDIASVLSYTHDGEQRISSTDENESSTEMDPETPRSRWDSDGNHLYPEDVRELKRQKHCIPDEQEEMEYESEEEEESESNSEVEICDSRPSRYGSEEIGFW